MKIADDITVEEFVAELYDGASSPSNKMTTDEAKEDLEMFRLEGWTMPDDITPEAFADAWNNLVDAYMAQGADDDQAEN